MHKSIGFEVTRIWALDIARSLPVDFKESMLRYTFFFVLTIQSCSLWRKPLTVTMKDQHATGQMHAGLGNFLGNSCRSISSDGYSRLVYTVDLGLL